MINKTKIRKLSIILGMAERLSAEICDSRGLKGTLESSVNSMHIGILNASGKVKVVREAVERKALLKRTKPVAFDVDSLNPEEVSDENI